MTLLPFLWFALTSVQDAPILQSTFASGEDGWTAVQIAGSGAKVSAVHDAEHLKIGTGSLRFEYAIGQGQTAGVALPVPGGLAKMASIHFWVRPSGNLPLIVSLTEKGGAEYNCVVSAAKDKWQEVALALDEFALNRDAGKPADGNGKLDAEQITSIALLDLNSFIAQNAAAASVLGVQPGSRTFYLSDFQISPKPLPPGGPAGSIEGFVRPQPTWGVLNAAPSIVSEAPLNARALRLDYNLTSGKAVGAFRPVRSGLLVGKRTIDFRVAARNACHLLVQLEEIGGGKYNATVEVPAGSVAVDRSVDLSELAPDNDSKDDNGKLDLDRVKQINFVDISALIDAPGQNTLWVGRITTLG